jgi:predicted  nucleic acid-binding Zn-ribbon protein
MTQQRRTALKDLQKLDLRIREAKQRIHDFDPLFEEVEEPALILETDLGTSRKRVQEMTLEERRLELSITEKKERLARLEERTASVRNLREEAAVSAELEMVKRALQNDEQEAFSLLDHVRKGEERLAELEAAFAEASELVEPRRNELIAQKEAAEKDLAALHKQREDFAGEIDPAELKVYNAIRGNGRAAIAELTEDGACANCFGIVPLQVQNEVRHGETLIRCEACGVILAAPEPVVESAEEDAVAEAEAEEPVDEDEGGSGEDADGADAGDDAAGEDEEEA